MARGRAALLLRAMSPRRAVGSQAADKPCPPGRASFGRCQRLTIQA